MSTDSSAHGRWTTPRWSERSSRCSRVFFVFCFLFLLLLACVTDRDTSRLPSLRTLSYASSSFFPEKKTRFSIRHLPKRPRACPRRWPACHRRPPAARRLLVNAPPVAAAAGAEAHAAPAMARATSSMRWTTLRCSCRTPSRTSSA